MTPTIHRGTIEGFRGSWGSGMGALFIRDEQGEVRSIPCDNAPTVRALERAFGNVIGDAHDVVAGGGHTGQEVYWAYDEYGLVLGGFVPVAEAPPELVEAYESQQSNKQAE